MKRCAECGAPTTLNPAALRSVAPWAAARTAAFTNGAPTPAESSVFARRWVLVMRPAPAQDAAMGSTPCEAALRPGAVNQARMSRSSVANQPLNRRESGMNEARISQARSSAVDPPWAVQRAGAPNSPSGGLDSRARRSSLTRQMRLKWTVRPSPSATVFIRVSLTLGNSVLAHSN